MSERIINDIVHGIIELPDYIKVIIDTDQFQRLRYISQLGFDSFVYPSAGYSRFEHSIGTFHLASKLIKQIKDQLDKDHPESDDPNVPKVPKVTENDIKCVEISALCHDLGHGPYSHFWEHAFDEGIPTRKHEILSAEIFEELMKTKKSGKTIMEKCGLKDENIKLIKNIILGEIEDKKKYFLFEIVANKISGLDVDKFDYLCRDSIYLGWSNKNKIHDVKRIMHLLRVVKDKSNFERNDEWHLAIRDREIFNIHDVFYYRHLLHRYGYQHKTVKAIECLFKNAIKQIVNNKEHRDEFIKNVLNEDYNTNLDDPNIWFSTKFISKVCDHHVWEIMKKYTNDIVKQIQERDLIKIHCQIQVIRKVTNQNGNIQHDMKSLTDILKENSIVKNIAISKFSLQSEGKGNPLLAVRFYRKNDQSKCFHMKEEDLPDLVKLINDEFIIMIFKDGNQVNEDNKDKNEDITSLDEIITILCSENFITLNSDKINDGIKIQIENIIKDLLEKYKFRKNLY